MLWYGLRKLGASLATLFAIALCTFLMARAVPGGPFDGEKALPPQIKEILSRKYGFDKPPLAHFVTYAKEIVLHGDLGVSLKFVDRPVSAIIAETFPISLSLGFYALIFALVVGIPLGIFSALRPHSWIDTSAMLVAVGGVTLPSFLIGALLVLLFCHALGWLPAARLDGPEYYILPVITLGLRPAGIIARLVRSTLGEELKMDYVRTARSKGLTERAITIRHALRNSWLPVLTVLGPITASIVTGSFIVEHFFAIPGMAKHFIEAVSNRDIFLMSGVTLVFAAVLLVVNLAVDLLYPLIDPRMSIR